MRSGTCAEELLPPPEHPLQTLQKALAIRIAVRHPLAAPRLCPAATTIAAPPAHHRRQNRHHQQQNADPAAAFNLGTALEELGRWGEALTGYRRALQLDPEYADAHFNLARLYEQLGRPAAALRHLRTYHWLKRS